MNTRLSVILPVYNNFPYLPDAVESILHQTYSNFRFIIVNDGSTDGSAEYLCSLNDPRILLINQPNTGQGAARKTALSRCQSEYVALMDADDISMPDRFFCQLNYLDAHPEVVLVGGQIEFLIGSVAQRSLPAPIDHVEIEARLLQGRAGLCNPSLMFRTEPALACVNYPSGLLGEDIDFALCMCERGRVANLDRILLRYRIHASQTSLGKTREMIRSNRYAAYRAVFRRQGLPEPTLDTYLKSASLFDQWRFSLEAWELVQYRSGRILIATGKPVRGFLRLALLGICRPFSTIRRIAQTIASSFRGTAN
jgi:glycosyltransferase involved in cell wall biosynthesis